MRTQREINAQIERRLQAQEAEDDRLHEHLQQQVRNREQLARMVDESHGDGMELTDLIQHPDSTVI